MHANSEGAFVVVGGVAAGMSAASQVRRRQPNREVIALEKGAHVSYGSCGMPYNIMDPARPIEDLVVVTAERFREERGVDVRTGHEALSIDLAEQTVLVRDHRASRDYVLAWGDLAITTGARATRPEIPGAELPGVFVLRDIGDGGRLKAFLRDEAPRRALIVGGGYIAMEMVEALAVLGIEVTVVVRRDRVLPRGYVDDACRIVEGALLRGGVRVVKESPLRAVREQEGRAAGLETEQGALDAELVLFATGVVPNAELAAASGIALGAGGAIAVDDQMRTSAPHVWSAGDCAHVNDLVSGEPVYIPLGTTANKQGRVLGANVAGAGQRFPGVVGSSIFRVFDLEVGQTGLSTERAAALGLRTVASSVTGRTRAHSYGGGGGDTTIHLLAEAESGRLLGAQVLGPEGVKGRIDVLATALHTRMDLEQLGMLDLAYAPPFSPVWDPLLIAAQNLEKKRRAKRQG